jgi:hypothetical protein
LMSLRVFPVSGTRFKMPVTLQLTGPDRLQTEQSSPIVHLLER